MRYVTRFDVLFALCDKPITDQQVPDKKGDYAAGAGVAERILPCVITRCISKDMNASSVITHNSPGQHGQYRMVEIAKFPQLACVVLSSISVTIHASIAARGGGYAETSIGSQTGDRKLMHSALSKLAAHPPRL
jgi:hypothetical protein